MFQRLVLVLSLSGCLIPVEVGFTDAGRDAGSPSCTVGQDQTCNELELMSSLAGRCTSSGCECNSGFELGVTGKCRPVGSCPAMPMTGQTCTSAGLECRYGFSPPECGGLSVKCQTGLWVEQRVAAGPTCNDGGVSCTGMAPACTTGTVGGSCSDAFVFGTCVGGAWLCPAGTVRPQQCACVGRLAPGCTCTPGGVVCSPCPSDSPFACNDLQASVPLGSCGATACECAPGAELNPATGKCRPIPLDGGLAVCQTDAMCNESMIMASFAGECRGQRCFCKPGFELAESGRCQLEGARCIDNVNWTCSDVPFEGDGGPGPGMCIVGQCLCEPGFELNPATGKCRVSRPAAVCTVGQDQTCNWDVSQSSIAGRCVSGQCSCLAGYVSMSDGRCARTEHQVCLSSASGTCVATTADGGTLPAASPTCGGAPFTVGCSCVNSPTPTPRCTGACSPTLSCTAMNCGQVNCVAPLRCSRLNVCEL